MDVSGSVIAVTATLGLSGGAYRYLWLPHQERKAKKDRERLFMDGADAIDGVAPEILPAATRLTKVETGVEDLKDGQLEIMKVISKHDEMLDVSLDALSALLTDLGNGHSKTQHAIERIEQLQSRPTDVGEMRRRHDDLHDAEHDG